MNLILIIALLSGVVADDFELPPDIVYGTSTVTGTLLGFQADDHMHAIVSTRGGGTGSYFTFDPLLDYFLSEHVGETLVLELQDVETYLIEAEEMVRLTRVTGARAGDVSFSAWRDSLESVGDPEELLGDYFSAPYDHIYSEEGSSGGGGGR